MVAEKHPEAGRTEFFTVMAKPVGSRCNLACSYCYYLETAGLYSSDPSAVMTDEMLELFVRQYIASSPGPVVPFTWHGGEPTLAGLAFFRRAVNMQKQMLPAGWSCWNNLQTNGILLDDDWCKFLAAEHFDVGLSLDGTSSLHDSVRLDLGGHGTYARATEAVRRLQRHGIQPDLLCTVTSAIASEPLSVYKALRDLDTGWIQFIPIVRRTPSGDLTEDSVSGEAFGRFLIDIFDCWSESDIGRLEVQLFAESAMILSGGQATVCQMAPVCGRVPVVEHDGSVFACDHFVDAGHRLGNLAADSLAALVDSAAQRQFGAAKHDCLPENCLNCFCLEVCNGGCPKDRFAQTADGQPGLNILCDGYSAFYKHAGESLRMIGEMRRQGAAPASIRASLRARALVRWQGIGRNDACPCGSGRKAKQCCWPKRPV